MKEVIKEELWGLRGLMVDQVEEFKEIVSEHKDKENYIDLWNQVSVYTHELDDAFEEFKGYHKIWCYFNKVTWSLFKLGLVNELYMSCSSRIHLKLWSDELSKNDKLSKEVQKLKLDKNVDKVTNSKSLIEEIKNKEK